MADTISELGWASGQIAMRAARAAIIARGIDPKGVSDADIDRLSGRIKARIAEVLEEALTDAREALVLGMIQAANLTYTASMASAGIKSVADVWGETRKGD